MDLKLFCKLQKLPNKKVNVWILKANFGIFSFSCAISMTIWRQNIAWFWYQAYNLLSKQINQRKYWTFNLCQWCMDLINRITSVNIDMWLPFLLEFIKWIVGIGNWLNEKISFWCNMFIAPKMRALWLIHNTLVKAIRGIHYWLSYYYMD